MADADLDITGLKEAAALIGQDLTVPLGAALFAIALEAQGRIAPYPAASHKPQAFKTAKQRRGFFAKLRSGQISVPYRRSGQLGSKWIADGGGAQIRLRNTAGYAGLVHSEKGQASYHRGTWKTDEKIADEVVGDGTAANLIEQALQKAFDGGD